ncbi:MAG: FG-GAP-like repeat-containing protein, partial [Planctomycetota bacterium]
MILPLPARSPFRPRSGALRRPALGALLAVAALLGGCNGEQPLVFLPKPIPVGNDAYVVNDVALVDPDNDGDLDLLVATSAELRYLQQHDGRFEDRTPGTALERVEPADRLAADGMDMILTRDGKHSRLVYSGIGSWHEEDGAVVTVAPPLPSLVADADFNGDGKTDRATIQGRIVRIALRDMAGVLNDATTRLGSDSLPLRANGRRLLAADLDGDGDTDLLAVGGRILGLFHNGGSDGPTA